MLILKSGYRQVTMYINKQEQPTPNGRELSRLLALMYEYFAGIPLKRDKSRKPYI